jgi:hypothetical protein
VAEGAAAEEPAALAEDHPLCATHQIRYLERQPRKKSPCTAIRTRALFSLVFTFLAALFARENGTFGSTVKCLKMRHFLKRKLAEFSRCGSFRPPDLASGDTIRLCEL